MWHYGEEDPEQIQVEDIEEGVRLETPSGMEESVEQLMMLCWHLDTSKRPNFGDICEMLQRYLAQV
jgi:hypothetical protein